MAKKNNRRVQLTKSLIKTAFLDLWQEKPFAQITVKDVCKTADLNRTTFYLHYADLDALFREIEQDAYEDVERYIRNVQSTDDKIQQLTSLFDYIQHNLSVYRMLLLSPESDSKNRFMQHFLSAISQGKKNSANAMTEAYTQSFIINGCAGMIISWIEDGFRISSAELAELVYGLCAGASAFSNAG